MLQQRCQPCPTVVWVLVGLSWGHIPEGCWVLMEFGEAVQALLIMGGCSPVSPGVHSQPFASSKVGTSGSPWVHSKTSHVLWE